MAMNYETAPNNMPGMDASRRQDWSREVTGTAPSSDGWNRPWMAEDTRIPNTANQPGGMSNMGNMGNMGGMGSMGGMHNMNGMSGMSSGLQMQNNLPTEVIEAPTTVTEAYLGSLKAMLMRNRGNYIVATFLIGTQNTVSWEGILYDVGNDYVTIYQPGRDRYVVTDMYSLKYMEFYDTRRREMCDDLMARQGMGNMSGQGLAQPPRGW